MTFTRTRRALSGVLILTASIGVAAPASASPGDNGPFAITMHKKTEEGRYLDAQVWTMDVDGGDFHQQFAALEEENKGAVWSPDGAWLAFHRGGSIVVARADGTDSRIVAQAAYGRISWSPDGSRLVFGRGEDGGDWSIWMVGADGTDEHQIYRGPWVNSPTWSPVGDRIAFAQQDPGSVNSDQEIYTMHIDGTNVQQVSFNESSIWDEYVVPVVDMQPAWSPDGRRLVVVSDRDAPLDCLNCPTDLYVSDADGSNVQRIHLGGNEFSPSWAPDGRSLAFVKEPTPPFTRTDPMWFDRYDLATGEVTHLHRADANSSLDWSVAPGSVPLADLRTRVTVPDNVQLVGSSASVTAVVTNDGPRGASEAALQLRLPAGVALDGSDQACAGTESVTCSIGAVAPGESVRLDVDVVLDAPGLGEVIARATSTTPDSDVMNNRSTAAVASCTQLGGVEDDVLAGTDAADVLCGAAGDDRLDGAGGNDILVGGLGDDVLIGSGGNDRVSYATADSSVRIDLTAGRAQGEGNDTFAGVENAVGTRWGDVLVGGPSGNHLAGGGGADLIDGRAGDDLIDGGSGSDAMTAGPGSDRVAGGIGRDAVSYAASPRGVTVNLSKRTAGGQGADRLLYVEDVTGSSHRDIIIGSVVTNELLSAAGQDRLLGLGGNDRIEGGAGGDMLAGGDGIDRLGGGGGRDRCDQQTGRGRSSSCEA